MSTECVKCKNFLDENNVYNKDDYKKWILKNHPDKFLKFGKEDQRYIDAEENSAMLNNCFPQWYGEYPRCVNKSPIKSTMGLNYEKTPSFKPSSKFSWSSYSFKPDTVPPSESPSKKSRKSRKSRKRVFDDNAPLGECRKRKKSVCKNDPNCTYRKRVGCVKKYGAKKNKYEGPLMPDVMKRRVGRPKGRKSARKSARKSTRKSAKKSARKSSKKSARKSAKKSAKNSSRKSKLETAKEFVRKIQEARARERFG